MFITTLFVAVLAAAAASFAALFFNDRKNTLKFESMSDSYMEDIAGLKCEIARLESQEDGRKTPLSMKVIVDFLKQEKTESVEYDVNNRSVSFNIRDEKFIFDCSRLPRQLILFKGWNMEGADLHWDILERAAQEVTRDMIMVKVRVYAGDSYDFMIVSCDHTLSALRENFDAYMTIISDSENKLKQVYWRIMQEEHPEECEAEESNASETDSADMAMKMAQMTGGNKVQS